MKIVDFSHIAATPDILYNARYAAAAENDTGQEADAEACYKSE